MSAAGICNARTKWTIGTGVLLPCCMLPVAQLEQHACDPGVGGWSAQLSCQPCSAYEVRVARAWRREHAHQCEHRFGGWNDPSIVRHATIYAACSSSAIPCQWGTSIVYAFKQCCTSNVRLYDLSGLFTPACVDWFIDSLIHWFNDTSLIGVKALDEHGWWTVRGMKVSE